MKPSQACVEEEEEGSSGVGEDQGNGRTSEGGGEGREAGREEGLEGGREGGREGLEGVRGGREGGGRRVFTASQAFCHQYI